MGKSKITPAIERFIQSNCTLTPEALSALILKKFKIQITSRALYPHVDKARAETAANNDAKVEAIRAQILNTGDLRAEKYLKYLDENVEALNGFLKGATGLKIESMKDYVATSQALLKSLSTVLDFVKLPEKVDVTINSKPDLSKLTDAELDAIETISRKAARSDRDPEGEGKAASS